MNDSFHRSQEFILNQVSRILADVDPRDIQRIISEFFDAKRIFVYGAGRSGLVARAFAIRLVHLGLQTFVIGETIGAPVKENDVVFLISGSGQTIPAVMTADIAHKIGAHLIVVTGEKDSRITRDADTTVVLSPAGHDDKRKLFAPLGTLFEASAWVLLDSIVAEIMDQKHETEELMRSRHATLELP